MYMRQNDYHYTDRAKQYYAPKLASESILW